MLPFPRIICYFTIVSTQRDIKIMIIKMYNILSLYKVKKVFFRCVNVKLQINKKKSLPQKFEKMSN